MGNEKKLTYWPPAGDWAARMVMIRRAWRCCCCYSYLGAAMSLRPPLLTFWLECDNDRWDPYNVIYMLSGHMYHRSPLIYPSRVLIAGPG